QDASRRPRISALRAVHRHAANDRDRQGAAPRIAHTGVRRLFVPLPALNSWRQPLTPTLTERGLLVSTPVRERTSTIFVPRKRSRAPSPRLRGEGWGEGDSPRTVLSERAPHPNPHRASFARLDPVRTGRGSVLTAARVEDAR